MPITATPHHPDDSAGPGMSAAIASRPSSTGLDERPLSEQAVYDHVLGICFKTGPPSRIGAEIEWIVIDPARPTHPVPLCTLRMITAAAGPPPAGSLLTLEPGGQVELSSPPAPDTASCIAGLNRDIGHLTTALHGAGLRAVYTASDPWLVRPRQLGLARYVAMADYFESLPQPSRVRGPQMMCATASLQVNVEAGVDRGDMSHRWRLLHDVGPTLVATFANSPRLAGRRTGWCSSRQAVWRRLDPPRTHPGREHPEEPWRGYGDVALDAPLMFVRRGEQYLAAPGATLRQWIRGALPHLHRPGAADLEVHLTTLFPPVRARGFFEVRYLDTQSPQWWPVPLIVLATLLAHRDLGDRAIAACAPVRDSWDRAARLGLRDPQLAAAAQAVFAGLGERLRELRDDESAALVQRFADRYVERRRCPADDPIPGPSQNPDPLTTVRLQEA